MQLSQSNPASELGQAGAIATAAKSHLNDCFCCSQLQLDASIRASVQTRRIESGVFAIDAFCH
ncbi:hypothetical protein SynBIOSE41_01191 [Synechococcus sp. BIOS-E4-1]|nr:hypothetical protein SynBIOSE41_01191 [Synechococcus sp. BIOS-E4-1]